MSISIITISFRWIGFIFKSNRLCAKPFLKSPTQFETLSIIEGEHFPYSFSMKGLIISIQSIKADLTLEEYESSVFSILFLKSLTCFFARPAFSFANVLSAWITSFFVSSKTK